MSDLFSNFKSLVWLNHGLLGVFRIYGHSVLLLVQSFTFYSVLQHTHAHTHTHIYIIIIIYVYVIKKVKQLCITLLSKSFIYITNNIVPSTNPCDTPLKADLQFELKDTGAGNELNGELRYSFNPLPFSVLSSMDSHFLLDALLSLLITHLQQV